MRRLQLAGQFAQLFERYQAYRPDLLRAWQSGEDAGDSQARLWQALCQGVDEPPRSSLIQGFMRQFGAADAAAPPALPARLFAYGCINVSPDVLGMLQVLARHLDLHFMMPTPCREYWGDLPRRRELAERLDEFGSDLLDTPPNHLLVSMGAVGREFVARVFEDDAVQVHQADDEVGDPPRTTLLERVQADIITLSPPDPADRLARPAADDRSIQVRLAHSPLREVQVLHDHLLDLLERDPDLQARDIAVMVPDVGRYAPAISAVFGALAPGDPRYLPWTVSDRAEADAHPLTRLFTELLELPARRLDLEQVLAWLEVPAARRRAGLEGSDLAALREMAHASGIRWGEDARDRVAESLPPFDDFSFSFGRRRLLLGHLLGEAGEDEALVRGIAPMGGLEGQGARDAGALFRLHRRLHALAVRMRAPRSAAGWQALFNRALDELLDVEDDDQAAALALAAIRRALQSLADDTAAAGFDQDIGWSCVRHVLLERLADSRGGQRYMDGGVNVCAMVPMRNVPFKAICLLGMDADSFPRRDPADALSHIQRDAASGRRRLGDRSVREDDRYLFLETVMAARRYLYLSYTGLDIKSGRTRAASVLLDEFVRHVCEGYFGDAESAREALVVTQPMHPFSPRLFGCQDARDRPGTLFTYRHEWQRAAAAGGEDRAGHEAPFLDCSWPAEPPEARVELEGLMRFFRAPQRAFLMQQAGLSINHLDEEIGREPLVLSARDQASMQRQLLAGMLQDPPRTASEMEVLLRARALLPPLEVGTRACLDAQQQLAAQARAWRDWRRPPQAETRAFTLDLGERGSLTGRIDGVHDNGWAGWVGRDGSVRRWFDWWLQALSYRAAIDADGDCRAFGLESRHGSARLPLTAAMPEAAAAREHLAMLVGLMHQGLADPLPLPPRCGWAMADVLAGGLRRNEDEAALRQRALNAAARTWYEGDWAESADPWIATALRGHRPFTGDDEALDTACMQLAERLYLPALAAIAGGRA